jgi:hypothetical protein
LGQCSSRKLLQEDKYSTGIPPGICTRKEAKLAVFAYIEGWYNRKRRHSTEGYLTPCHFESLFLRKTMAA